MMEGDLVTVALLLLSVTWSSSLDPMVTTTEKSNDKDVTTTGISDTFIDNSTSDKGSKEIEVSTAKLPTIHASTIEPGVTPKQEMVTTGATSVEEASTSTSKEPTSTTFIPRPVNDLISSSTDLPVTSHEDSKTDGNETTTSHPHDETVRTSKPVNLKPPQNSPLPTKKPVKSTDVKTVILIAVCMVILFLILIAVIVILVRNKRRSGSQSFQSRSSKRESNWAGQVPDLGDGTMTEHPVGTENGAARNKPGKEQEMITFISSEKKEESVEEVNEMNNGDTLEEQKPLLEDGPPEKEETPPALMVEQELV
ncbi:uncharacterized protein ACNLHF_025912 [Anomaloglossus baeobatrachus]|uniref:uncharacterized protein LOC142246545 n=1 Tax=Anomaloglossus baeobatrachus TaxID=238106 RepID=UPI003F4F4306